MLNRWWPGRGSALCAIIALAIFGALTVAVLAADRGPVGPDLQITRAMNDWARSGGYGFWAAVTYVGQWEVIAPAYLLLAGAAIVRRRWWVILFIALAACYSLFPNVLVKEWVARARPPIQHDYNLATFESFPSGHTGSAAALAAAVFCVVAMSLTGVWRWIVTICCVVMTVMTALSRLALGVHYPTDVLAGAALATAWVLGVGAMMKWLHARS